MGVAAPALARFTNVGGTAVAGTAEVTLTFGPSFRGILLAVRCIRSAGVSGTNMQPRIYNVSAAAAGTIGQKWRAAGATAPGTLINTNSIDTAVYGNGTDVLYFIVDGDAADTFSYEIIFEVRG